MYLDFHKLKKEPFNITPDPSFLFLSPSHKEALAAIIYGIEKRKGFAAITGEVGVGKTTILRSYLEKCDKKRLKTVYIFNTNVTFPSLLKTICLELAIPVGSGKTDEMLRQFHQFLIREYRRGGNTVLIIDEAQNMPMDTLEHVRMLSIESATDKLIQVVFSGQPEFDQILEQHELRQLKQRIAVRATIAPLTAKESAEYINNRLRKAGNKDAEVFTPSAMRRIIRHSHGIPRVLNVLCDNALITAFGYQKKQVDYVIAGEIIRDFTGKKEKLRQVWRISLAALTLIAGTLGLARFAMQPPEGNPEKKLMSLPPRPSIPGTALHESTTKVPLPDKGTVPVTKVGKTGDKLPAANEHREIQ